MLLLLAALSATTALHAQIVVTDQSLQASPSIPGETYHFDASVATMAAPTGQEFTPFFNGLDFVDVRLEPRAVTNTGTFQISIHESTITGPILAVSASSSIETNLFPDFNIHCTFAHTVPLAPGALYVLEINQIAGDSGWGIDCQNSTGINGQTNSDALIYPGGRFINADTIRDSEDMMFREGVFAHVDLQLTPTNTFRLSWPAAVPGAIVQRADSITRTNWSDVTTQVASDGTNNTIVIPITVASAFYRLRAQ